MIFDYFDCKINRKERTFLSELGVPVAKDYFVESYRKNQLYFVILDINN